ncbi:MAG TPA: hypothetical protein VI547_07150 [Anaerolineales bacterium]|nr:hypothetical protein [Anaerolineales bacterium]HLF01737.1 hypothetical protein [Anaerolineales bacterium]
MNLPAWLRQLCRNTDTLFILATDERNANHLVELAEEWEADTAHVHGQDNTQHELGSGGLEQQRLVSFWWD